MASYDNRQWILSLIQNAYVTTDDTGLCEVILQQDEGKNKVAEFPFFSQVDDLSFLNSNLDPEPHSPDITTDLELPRHRSYTEKKSERLKKEKEKASRVKRIPWRYNPSAEVCDSELSEMFQRKVSFARRSDTSDGEPPPKATSLLSHLISNSDVMKRNAYIDYSKFDGFTHNNVATKELNIFLHVGNNPSLDYPLKVSVISSARVSDLIGLICWIYTKENRQPPLKTMDNCHLYIADEDGQYDSDFSPLERGHKFDKYGFTTLALVEKELPKLDQGRIVTVTFARGAFSKIEVPNTDVTLREILNKSISRRKEIAKMKEAGVDYHLEKEDEPGIALKLDKTIGQVGCTEFAAVRDNSKRTNGREVLSPSLQEVTSTQSFIVTWVQRFTKCETRVEISGDKLKIHPFPMKGGSSILPLRISLPLFYQINQLVECSRKAALKKGKVELIVTVRGEDSFKDFKFLCDPLVGEEIYDKCRYLIKINSTRLKSNDMKQVFRRHNSLSLRKKTKNGGSSFEI